jgi:hypothetical protein
MDRAGGVHPILTFIHWGREASLRYPDRSGSCSISAGRTAGSVLWCWFVVVEVRVMPRKAPSRLTVCERCVRTISRSPIKREAN